MLFVQPRDFFEKAASIPALNRDEELSCARAMAAGDQTARQRLVEGYLPMVAGVIRRLPESERSLELIYRCCSALEKAVDSFNFLQDSERFSHRLSWYLRQTIVRWRADK